MHDDNAVERQFVAAELTTLASRPRTELKQRWTERHGVQAAARLAAAEDFADAVEQEITPPNTVRTYGTSWRVWERFCGAQGFPVTEGSRGALVAYVAWLLREGRQKPSLDGVLGYAPASAEVHLNATIAGLRERGHTVSRDDASVARQALDGLTVRLLKDGERRGRGKAPAADTDGLRRIAASLPDTLTGHRDKALVLLTFNVAGRASEPAGLLLGDVTVHPQGLRVAVRTGKTKWSVRQPAVPYTQDPTVCPVRAWVAWREALLIEGGEQYADPADPAFHTIDRWGHVGGAMSPDAVTRAVTRVAERSGVPLRWTGHSLRSGLASMARLQKKDSVVIARQGGWAPNSRSMLGYMQTADDWTDNAADGLL